jgi:uncharacterized protein DUF6412
VTLTTLTSVFPVLANFMLALLSDLWQLTVHALAAPSGLSALAVTVLAGAVLVGALAVCLASGARLGRRSAAVPLARRAAALREKSWRAAYTEQRDPDAAGRPRPRAPSAALAAAIW